MHGHAHRRLLSARRAGDRGAAVVEFVLVGTLVVFLFLIVLQVGLILHMRNVVVASAAEGAREAANADRDCVDGAARAHDIVEQSLNAAVARDLTFAEPADGCEEVDANGLTLVRVRVDGELPIILLPITSLRIDVTARAIKEGQ